VNTAGDASEAAQGRHAGARWWASIGDARALRNAGLFVAEGRLVVERLLTASDGPVYEVVRVLASPAAVRALHLDERVPGLLDVRTPAAMQELTGYNFHRGVLALVRRPPHVSVADLVAGAPADAPLVVGEHIVDVDNVGSLFRNARAFGAAGVVLDDTSADPLYRKAVRTSMGTVLELPWTRAAGPEMWGMLRRAGYRLMALTPAADAVPLREAMTDAGRCRVAIVVGNEGEGLSQAALAACDVPVRIPMAHGADSINVATALAVALYEVHGRRR
jgi:tRNA G18 (ribose-2'-O)-methylase SpoU